MLFRTASLWLAHDAPLEWRAPSSDARFTNVGPSCFAELMFFRTWKIMSARDARGPEDYCLSAQPIILPRKASQASICERATNSSG